VCIDFDYEAVDIEAECNVSACVSLEGIPTEGETGVAIGSGVCVDSRGVVLTAGHMAPFVGCHCIVAFADGVTFDGICFAVDKEWDLALLQLQPKAQQQLKRKAGKGKGRGGKKIKFPFVSVSAEPPCPKDKLVCVGQPGRPRGERLEVVTGKVVRIVKDPLCPQNNVDSDGGLEHCCPVFAGNSGSALLLASSGELVGLHTGYNMCSYSYHGTTLQAIRAFIDQHCTF
jgi:S1-C subfamily serine protease